MYPGTLTVQTCHHMVDQQLWRKTCSTIVLRLHYSHCIVRMKITFRKYGLHYVMLMHVDSNKHFEIHAIAIITVKFARGCFSIIDHNKIADKRIVRV